MFGGNNNKSFAFGAQPSSSNLFGEKSASNTGFGFSAAKPGLFGSSTTTTATTGFGAGGLFGTPSSTGGGLFGTTTTTAQQPSGQTLFGQNPQNSGFLKPSTNNAFGATTTGFGVTGGGLFGAATTQAQEATSGGLFGASTATAAGGGLFGAATNAVTGTCVHKFVPAEGTDQMVKSGVSTQVKTKHYCISGMKTYEAKSLEELRLDDYAAGVKGPRTGTTATASGTLFGATQPAASTTGFGGFGTTTTTASTGFGGFGGSSTTGFGAKPAGGLFGATATSGGLFGATSSAAAPAFGAAPASTSGGLFGATAAKPNPFGTTQTFGFGQTSAAPTTGFGFAAKPAAAAFGAPTSSATGFGGFGTQPTANTGFGFGAKATPAFGAPATASSTGFGFGSLGQTASTGFGLNKPATGFGAAGTTFGAPGLSTAAAQQQQPVQLASNIDLQTQQALMQQQIFALANSPYGDSPLFRNVKKESKKSDLVPTDPVAQQSVLAGSGNKLKVNSRPAAKVKLTNLPSVQAIGTSSTAKGDLFEGLEDDCLTPDRYGARRSVKKLVLRGSPAVGSSSSRITTADQQPSAFTSPSLYSAPPRMDNAQTPLADETFDLSGANAESRRPVNKLYPTLQLDDTLDQLQAQPRPAKHSPVDRKPNITDSTFTTGTRLGDNNSSLADSPQAKDGTPQATLPVHKEEQESVNLDIEQQETALPHPCGVISTRSDYYTLPDLDELGNYLDANGDCFVENLSIGREGYGSVFFPGTTNVANLDIDNTVHFRRKEITVYPDDDNKPTEGQGLNKIAEVTLDCVWPTDKTSRTHIKSPERLKVMNYQEKIEQATTRIGAKFIDYRPDTGSWVFEVKHFSKYGLLDDDSDEDNTTATESKPKDAQKLKSLHIQSLNVQKKSISQLGSAQRHKLASGDSPITLGGVPTSTPSAANYLDIDGDEENLRPGDGMQRNIRVASPYKVCETSLSLQDI